MTIVLPASKIPKDFLEQLLKLGNINLAPNTNIEVAFEVRTVGQAEKLEAGMKFSINDREDFNKMIKSFSNEN